MTAYLIANYDVNDEERYQAYLEAALPTIDEHDGEILVAGADSETVEGELRAVTVVIRFPSMDKLRQWYGSAEYQRIMHLRTQHTRGGLAFAREW